jgi:hypothetical protein
LFASGFDRSRRLANACWSVAVAECFQRQVAGERRLNAMCYAKPKTMAFSEVKVMR